MTILERLFYDREGLIAALGDKAQDPDIQKVLQTPSEQLLEDATVYYFLRHYGVKPFKWKVRSYGIMTPYLVPESVEQISDLYKSTL